MRKNMLKERITIFIVAMVVFSPLFIYSVIS